MSKHDTIPAPSIAPPERKTYVMWEEDHLWRELVVAMLRSGAWLSAAEIDSVATQLVERWNARVQQPSRESKVRF
jgi:hypothetical protein